MIEQVNNRMGSNIVKAEGVAKTNNQTNNQTNNYQPSTNNQILSTCVQATPSHENCSRSGERASML
jgi:hypothetical protein